MSLRQRWMVYGLITCAVGVGLALIAYLVSPRPSDVLPATIATPAIPSVTIATPATIAVTPTPVFTFGALGDVQSIVIEDSESRHMLPGAKLTATLHPQGRLLVGEVVVVPNNYYNQTASPQNQQIKIPEQETRAFLQGLIQAATETPTSPITLDESTDCDSQIRIIVQTAMATARYDMTNGCKYLPWNIQYGNVHTISYARTTDDALNFITDDLGYGLLEQLAYPYKRSGR